MNAEYINKKIGFLFGAGAELSYGLPSGLDFIREVFFNIKEQGKICKALENKFNSKYFHNTVKYRSDKLKIEDSFLKSCLFLKSLNSEEFLKNYSLYILYFLSTDKKNKLKQLYGENIIDFSKSKKDFSDKDEKSMKDFEKEFEKIIKGEIKNTNHPLCKELFVTKDNKIDIDYSIGVSSELDSYFHTIANPYRFGKIRFWKIFNYYWFCYFSII